MSSTLWESFGPWLQHQRELAKVSQAQVAKDADIHVVQVSRIENGHSGAKRETVLAIVEAINRRSAGHNVDQDEALRRSGFAGPVMDDTFDLLKKARISFMDNSFSEAEKERILDMIRVLIAGALAAKGDKENN